MLGIRDPVVRLNITCRKNEIKFLIHDGTINIRKSLRSPSSYCFTFLFLCEKERLFTFSLVVLEEVRRGEISTIHFEYLPVYPQLLFSNQVSFHLTLFQAICQYVKAHLAINIQTSFCLALLFIIINMLLWVMWGSRVGTMFIGYTTATISQV